jgi:hypothetical protein
VDIHVEIRFDRHEGGQASFTVQCAAVTDAVTLDMSLLGRDVTDYFALIVDHPGNAVALVNQRHRYTIVTT